MIAQATPSLALQIAAVSREADLAASYAAATARLDIGREAAQHRDALLATLDTLKGLQPPAAESPTITDRLAAGYMASAFTRDPSRRAWVASRRQPSSIER